MKASKIKTPSTPIHSVAKPPIAIPVVKIILQVAVDIILASTKRSGGATLGIEAVLAGSKIADSII